jgi:hypothetical protein
MSFFIGPFLGSTAADTTPNHVLFGGAGAESVGGTAVAGLWPRDAYAAGSSVILTGAAGSLTITGASGAAVAGLAASGAAGSLTITGASGAAVAGATLSGAAATLTITGASVGPGPGRAGHDSDDHRADWRDPGPGRIPRFAWQPGTCRAGRRHDARRGAGVRSRIPQP